jgi:hypothetical protein
LRIRSEFDKAGSYRSRWSTQRRAAIVPEYLSIYEQEIRALITRRTPLWDAARCYQLLDQGAGDVMQMLIDYRPSSTYA